VDQLGHRLFIEGLARLPWIRCDLVDGDLSEVRAHDVGARLADAGDSRC
jgi:hypothetical protein